MPALGAQFELAMRAHSPQQAAGLASEIEIISIPFQELPATCCRELQSSKYRDILAVQTGLPRNLPFMDGH
jgi:hypothetical protein